MYGHRLPGVSPDAFDRSANPPNGKAVASVPVLEIGHRWPFACRIIPLDHDKLIIDRSQDKAIAIIIFLSYTHE